MTPCFPGMARGHAFGLILLVLLHGLVFWSLAVADPAELHDDEILDWPTVAHEFNRGAFPASAIPQFLNGKILYWETLVIAGFFRMFGASFFTTLFIAYLNALLVLLLWHHILRQTAGSRAALYGGVALAAGTPSYLVLSAQLASPHMVVNLCLALTLAVFLPYAMRGSRAGVVTGALLMVLGLTLARGYWVTVLALAVVGLVMPGRLRWRSLGISLVLAVMLKLLVPPFGSIPHYSSPVIWDEDPLWALLAQRFSPTVISRVAVDVITTHLPASFGLGTAAGICLTSGLLLALPCVFGLSHRFTAIGQRLLLFLGAYLAIYAVLLGALRFDVVFGEHFLPLWRRLRYLVNLTPLFAALFGLACSLLPRRAAAVLCMVFAAGSLTGTATTLTFQHQPFDSYGFTCYQLVGEDIARRLTPANQSLYRNAIDRFSPEGHHELFSAMGMIAVDAYYPPERFSEVRQLVPPDWLPVFYRSAGYWSRYFRPPFADPALRERFVEAEYLPDYLAGAALYRGNVNLANLYDVHQRGEIFQLPAHVR